MCLLLLFFVGFLFFVMDNLDTETEVRLGKRAYPSVQLFVVVLASIFVGMVYAGIIAVAEGANARLANRRRAREGGKLETELKNAKMFDSVSCRLTGTGKPAEVAVKCSNASTTRAKVEETLAKASPEFKLVDIVWISPAAAPAGKPKG